VTTALAVVAGIATWALFILFVFAIGEIAGAQIEGVDWAMWVLDDLVSRSLDAAVALFVGVPLWMYLRSQGRDNSQNATIVGLVSFYFAPRFFAALYALGFSGELALSAFVDIPLALVDLVVGALVGSVMWRVAYRPEKSKL
jgi:hypothetical protein